MKHRKYMTREDWKILADLILTVVLILAVVWIGFALFSPKRMFPQPSPYTNPYITPLVTPKESTGGAK